MTMVYDYSTICIGSLSDLDISTSFSVCKYNVLSIWKSLNYS